jgi:hypothetical protein
MSIYNTSYQSAVIAFPLIFFFTKHGLALYVFLIYSIIYLSEQKHKQVMPVMFFFLCYRASLYFYYHYHDHANVPFFYFSKRERNSIDSYVYISIYA